MTIHYREAEPTRAFGGLDGIPTDHEAAHQRYRFMRARIECALLGRDLRAVTSRCARLRNPDRRGCVGRHFCWPLRGASPLRPQRRFGDGRDLDGRMQSGALYVRLGETLHPVLNLASAVDREDKRRPAADSRVGARSRQKGSRQEGSATGIPGAPAVLGTPLAEGDCGGQSATAVTYTVVVGRGEGPQSHILAHDQTLLVRPSSGGSTYLLSAVAGLW